MYEIYVSVNFGPFEPYEMGFPLSRERVELALARLRFMTRRSGDLYRYEIRKV